MRVPSSNIRCNVTKAYAWDNLPSSAIPSSCPSYAHNPRQRQFSGTLIDWCVNQEGAVLFQLARRTLAFRDYVVRVFLAQWTRTIAIGFCQNVSALIFVQTVIGAYLRIGRRAKLYLALGGIMAAVMATNLMLDGQIGKGTQHHALRVRLVQAVGRAITRNSGGSRDHLRH